MRETIMVDRPWVFAVLAAFLAACGGGEPTAPAGDAGGGSVSVASVEVTPSSGELDALEATLELSAEARDGDGNALSGQAFEWSSSDEAVVTVDGDGVVTAVANGNTTVEATTGDVTGQTAVTVRQVPVEVDVGPPEVTLDTQGATADFSVESADANGHPVDDVTYVWRSSAPGVATVDDEGVATARGAGETKIVATAEPGGVADTARLTVELNGAPSVAIQSPSDGATYGSGESVTFQGSASDPQDGSLSGPDLVWASDVDGQLGTGASFSRSDLSVNQHAISLTATDSDGLSSTISVDIIVEEASPPDGDPDVAPELTGPSETTSPFTLTWTYSFTPCSICSSNDGYQLEESTTSSTSGFATTYDSFNQAERESPKSLQLDREAGTYWYRVRAYDAAGGGWTPYSDVLQVTVENDPRRFTIRNQMSTSLSIHEVVQVKVIPPNTTFDRSDRLTDDPASCLGLPGESIQSGQSRSFGVTIGDAYWVFIGIGIWDLDNAGCPSSRPWFKRRFFTDPSFNVWYVWTEVHVSGHDSGDFGWTISGSYLDGSLTVTPDGGSPIPFQRTQQNPIP